MVIFENDQHDIYQMKIIHLTPYRTLASKKERK